MPAWAWVLVAIAAGILVALIVWQALKAQRSRGLKQRFGPEYDRTVERSDSRGDAETELEARKQRRDQLDIRPLSSAARERYRAEWRRVQARFVDDPTGAVQQSDTLIQSVMRERGYPVEDFEQQAADVSVDHPEVVEHYRKAHAIHTGSRASTEELREAMLHYRALFAELLEGPERETQEVR